MTDVLIKRELLERIDETAICDGTDATISDDLFTQLVAALAAPRQPEGDAISRERVQSEADAFFDWPTADKSSVTTTSCLIFARCIAGMVAAERDATIAELRDRLDVMTQCADNYSRMFEESAEECSKLAGLLRDVGDWIDRTSFHGTDAVDLMQRIDAALAEVGE